MATSLRQVESLIQAGDSVYAAISRIGDRLGCARYMPVSVIRDTRPATPRRLLAAAGKLCGYGGQLVREQITGATPVCDGHTAASVAAVLQHAV